MAKIPRKTQKIFGSTAGGTGITEYGSPAGGSPVYSTDLDDIQTAEWDTGWAAAALAGTEIPTFQDFNAIHYTATNQLGYLLQEGVAEYDAGTEYHQNSIVKKTGTYELYGSVIDTNTGNALPNQVTDANWQYLGDLSDLSGGAGVEVFESSEQTIVSAGSFTVAHGLSAEPLIVSVKLVCKIAQSNWLVGDVVDYSSSGGQGDTGSGDVDRGFTIEKDSTNLFLRYGNQGADNTIRILDKTTGAILTLTNNNWRVVVTAIALTP